MAKGKKLGLYLNSDVLERFENLKGKRVLIKRHDALGNPYMDEIKVESDTSVAMRKGFDLFLDLAERQATIDATKTQGE